MYVYQRVRPDLSKRASCQRIRLSHRLVNMLGPWPLLASLLVVLPSDMSPYRPRLPAF